MVSTGMFVLKIQKIIKIMEIDIRILMMVKRESRIKIYNFLYSC